jgi:hypothetical protein
MTGARLVTAWLGLFLATGCSGGSQPPAELAGLWSAGPAACAAGVGVRFGPRAIEAVYEEQRETLFERPRYRVEGLGENFRVRITYALPRLPGGARSLGAHGVIVMVRRGVGVVPAAHNLMDGRTGSARLRIANDAAIRALTLTPCGAHPWREQLRGRAA